jgi:hypothetical protein
VIPQLTSNVLTGSEATAPLRPQRCGSVGELDLSRRERFLLAIGVHIACAIVAVADRPNARHNGRTH